MKTTLEIPESLFRKAKIRAAEEGISFKSLVITALEHTLESEPAFASEKISYEANSHGWPILPKTKGKKVTNDWVDSLRNEEGI